MNLTPFLVFRILERTWATAAVESKQKAVPAMRPSTIGAVLSFLFLLGFQANSASAEDKSYRNNLAEAVSMAHIDFVEKLEELYSDEPHPSAEQFTQYVRNPRSYSLGISETDDSYVVVFRLRRTPLFVNVVGGGAAYVIRKSDLSIVKFIENE